NGDRHRIPNLGRRPGIKSVGAIRRLRTWEDRQDVILTNTAVASSLGRMTGTSVPIVYFAHGLHWDKSRDFKTAHWRAIERILLRRTQGMIVLNTQDEEWI